MSFLRVSLLLPLLLTVSPLLAKVEDELRRRTIERLMTSGVTFRNPSTVVIDSIVAEAASRSAPSASSEGRSVDGGHAPGGRPPRR